MTQELKAPHIEELVATAQVLVFDFDGTLVDSNPIKAYAFARCFEDVPATQQQAVLAYCQANHHTPRGDKFRHVVEQMLQQRYTPDMEREYHRRFNAYTTRQIIEASAMPGAELFLQWAASRCLTALLSSTPHETLLEILEGRRWTDYFRIVRGAPVDKDAWLRALRRERQLEPHDVVFFGDTQEDANAAAASGCTYVAVANRVLSGQVAHEIASFLPLVAR